MQPIQQDPERVLGVWKRSPLSPGFWFRVVFTAGLYLILLYDRRNITLTNRRVTYNEAQIVGGRETSISIANITEVSVITSPLGALMGFSDVRIQSKGGGDTVPEIFFRSSERPNDLKRAIFELQDRVRNAF
jgi:Bacterial PH domain